MDKEAIIDLIETSDNTTTITTLKESVKSFCGQRDWNQFHNPKDLAIAIITEASELMELFRFKSNDEAEQMLNNDLKRQQIADELVDVFYFILRFAQKYDFDLCTEFARKMEQNEAKYPKEKFRGSNKKYSEV